LAGGEATVTILAALLLMLLVMDPLGNVPVLLSLLENVPPARRRWVLFRESVFALGFLLVFLYLGRYVLGMLAISQEALGIAGVGVRSCIPALDPARSM
jgi:multiple antibiotic resistance protein